MCEIVPVECAECGVIFGVPRALHTRRKEDGKAFTCPSGHSNAFIPSEVQRLRDALAKKELEIAQINKRHNEIFACRRCRAGPTGPRRWWRG